MRILTRGDQGDVYKKLVEIIKVLAKVQSVERILTVEAQDAISDALDIAGIVGGTEMLEALGRFK